ncbi:MAG TPA: hypothetical protein VHD87_17050, partial [Acidimicrobiales bacterium]|nr:hypothetical protein [Acidimicrobiales bacterium]
MIVTTEQLERYRRDGFIVIPDLLTPDEVERFGAAVTAGVKWRTKDHTVPLEERSNYQQSFLQCMNLWEDRPDVAPLTFHPRVCQTAA